MSEAHTDLQGLKGWLIVVGLGVVIGPLQMLAELPKIYKDMFYGAQWAAMNTPGNNSLHWAWKPLILMELSFSVAAFLGSMLLFCMYIGKQRAFPRLFIAMHIVSLLFFVADTTALRLILPDRPLFADGGIVALLKAVIPPLIWIPYMLKSERVKLTFVE